MENNNFLTIVKKASTWDKVRQEGVQIEPGYWVGKRICSLGTSGKKVACSCETQYYATPEAYQVLRHKYTWKEVIDE